MEQVKHTLCKKTKTCLSIHADTIAALEELRDQVDHMVAVTIQLMGGDGTDTDTEEEPSQ